MAGDPMGIGRAGEAPAYAGTDFIIARDGRIAAVYLFSTSYPELDSVVRRPMRRIGNGAGNISRSPKLPCSWFGGCDEG
jgi:hypothetical protein